MSGRETHSKTRRALAQSLRLVLAWAPLSLAALAFSPGLAWALVAAGALLIPLLTLAHVERVGLRSNQDIYRAYRQLDSQANQLPS